VGRGGFFHSITELGRAERLFTLYCGVRPHGAAQYAFGGSLNDFEGMMLKCSSVAHLKVNRETSW
jgi:hypothetical protein